MWKAQKIESQRKQEKEVVRIRIILMQNSFLKDDYRILIKHSVHWEVITFKSDVLDRVALKHKTKISNYKEKWTEQPF